MSLRILTVGHSPDPDDAFMFYGLAHGLVKIDGFEIKHVMEDIQTLNQRALKAELAVTAISAHVYPMVSKDYYIMRTGASMGEGYGPVVVSRKYRSIDELKGKKVAHPGEFTTALLLTKIYVPDVELVYYPFDEIMNAIDENKVDAGVIIHEGQITYEKLGYYGIMDYGKVWQEETNLPLPLGLDVVRKDLGYETAVRISKALSRSIKYGYDHIEDAVKYAQGFGRGLEFNLTEKFVKMYVSKLTIDMGIDGEKALKLLFDKAYERGLISEKVEFELV